MAVIAGMALMVSVATGHEAPPNAPKFVKSVQAPGLDLRYLDFAGTRRRSPPSRRAAPTRLDVSLQGKGDAFEIAVHYGDRRTAITLTRY